MDFFLVLQLVEIVTIIENNFEKTNFHLRSIPSSMFTKTMSLLMCVFMKMKNLKSRNILKLIVHWILLLFRGIGNPKSRMSFSYNIIILLNTNFLT